MTDRLAWIMNQLRERGAIYGNDELFQQAYRNYTGMKARNRFRRDMVELVELGCVTEMGEPKNFIYYVR